jgi:hypothetical protein
MSFKFTKYRTDDRLRKYHTMMMIIIHTALPFFVDQSWFHYMIVHTAPPFFVDQSWFHYMIVHTALPFFLASLLSLPSRLSSCTTTSKCPATGRWSDVRMSSIDK